MILIDTSCWIEFYRPSGDVAVRRAVETAIRREEAATTGIVKVELLAYVRAEARKVIDGDFHGLHWLETDAAAYDEAIRMGRVLRDRGLTVPATDLIIAATAAAHGARLLRRDGDFAAIASVDGAPAVVDEICGG